LQRAPYSEQHRRKQGLKLKNKLLSLIEDIITLLKPKKVRFSLVEWQHCDMGIAMCHFECTCKELNLEGKWEMEDPCLPHLPPKTEYIVSWHGRDSQS
jgi:hypothetical protein